MRIVAFVSSLEVLSGPQKPSCGQSFRFGRVQHVAESIRNFADGGFAVCEVACRAELRIRSFSASGSAWTNSFRLTAPLLSLSRRFTQPRIKFPYLRIKNSRKKQTWTRRTSLFFQRVQLLRNYLNTCQNRISAIIQTVFGQHFMDETMLRTIY